LNKEELKWATNNKKKPKLSWLVNTMLAKFKF
jgi:hypothetical protein